ncbi:19813_t:CDS:1 [Dentiscutata erythropus]|uniref:19813_t:CDS:1 n=1 Tax=Dentiscutata erythropus TaxID=1348616 RepID=A0A9N9JIR6_9GLOM|nr:19813_t:CDS:1 [Dentiscutata erythropus]
MSYTIRLRNSSKKAKLKKKLDDGDIEYSYDVFQSKPTSSDHDSIIDNWISSYGVNQQTKNQLNSFKKQKVGKAKKTFNSIIINGKKVSIFIIEFGEEDSDRNREYSEASANVELTSDDKNAKKLINSCFEDLAILALTGGSDSYTLFLE